MKDPAVKLLADMRRKVERPRGVGEWVYLTTPKTSTSWDGDSFSDTALTKIDLSAVFSAPAGIRAVLLRYSIRDSGSAGTRCTLGLSPTDAGGVNDIPVECGGVANDNWVGGSVIVPCNADGDIYYRVEASGASTFEAYLQIWGYYL